MPEPIAHRGPARAGAKPEISDLRQLTEVRARRPEAIAAAAAHRRRPAPHQGKLLIIAADHPARGALRAGADAYAMGDRAGLLHRIRIALERPGVHGVLGTPDILEDLLLLGALDDKVVFGSMNRGGLAGTVFEVDDRFTGYDAAGIARSGFDGGKMLLRIDPDDPATAGTLQACATAISELAERRLIAMVEPFIAHRTAEPTTADRRGGPLRNELTADAMVRAVTVAAGLGSTSAYTWLKVPVVDDMDRVLSATTLPALLLGGEVPDDPDAAFARMRKALAHPAAQGLVIGRSLLYPPGRTGPGEPAGGRTPGAGEGGSRTADVADAVDRAVSLL
ncbi:aldolase [Actinoplanes sp. DH11]|uniref:Cgl0159 family (beta/alpha)8-fold protein n=1 Tax=Actinoplanes sp. DH11 TaxID=2857011 RepID=UPI001E29EAB5|nr:aldolase [Actinoplanes sp. DH11]